LTELKKNYSKNFDVFFAEKETFKNWISTIFKTTFNSKSVDVKKAGFGFIADVVEQVTLSTTSPVDHSTFWNDVLSIARKEFDAFDHELKESAADLVAKIPPLGIDLGKVRQSLKHFFHVHIQFRQRAGMYTTSYNYFTNECR
jgi:hypothetical protein